MAIERTTSKAKIEVIWRGGHLACKVLRVVESLILVSVLNRFLVPELSPGSTHSKNTSNGTTINHGKCTSNMMQCMHDMRDVICDAYACSGRKKDEQGSNLANQVCHWKDDMISVEIDIKITGNGCTVCKWQAKQE